MSASSIHRCVAAFVLMLSLGATAEAQDRAHPRILSVAPSVVWLDDSITVELQDRDKWLQTSDAARLIVYLDGHALPNVKARLHGEDSTKATFKLSRDDSSRLAWATLLARPDFEERTVRLQVGLPDRPPFASDATVQLRTLDSSWFIGAVVLFGILLASFVWLAYQSDLLREGTAPATGERRPFSLGRVQMAVFFFLVVAAFGFIWITTGAHDPLTPSVLGLLGISAGTAASAAIVDANKDKAIENRGTALSDERRRIETEVKALEAKKAALNEQIKTEGAQASEAVRDQEIEVLAEIARRQERRTQIDQELGAVAAMVQPAQSEGLLTDILSDAAGVSFHRFQIVAWTLVLSVVFIETVYNSLAMPDFDPKLLALMGLSAGTYLGFKFPETR